MKKNTFLLAALLILSCQFLCAQNFITRWNLATAGSGATQLTFGVATAGTVNYTWQELSPGTATGSGTVNGVNCTITGLPAGSVIRLQIAPTNFQRIAISNGADRDRLTQVEQWGSVAWTGMQLAFFGCTNLQVTATDVPNLAGVTSMYYMFGACTNLNSPSNINTWNTGAVTDMSDMFVQASAFNQNIGSWNTAAVTNMKDMFVEASAFNQNIGSWNTGAVTNMSHMFYIASAFNGNIGSWNTAAVTTMNSMFVFASAFNQNIGSWNTGAVTNMANMFNQASTFNQNIGSWNTAAVTTMASMFSGASAFNQNIGSWNTGAVTDMSYLFYGASAFNGNIGSWNTGAVTTMQSTFNMAGAFNQNIGSWNTAAVTNMFTMFRQANAFNGNVGSWNTAAVTNMSGMFYQAGAFNQNIGSWTLNPVVSMAGMLDNTAMNCTNYSATLAGWNANVSTPNSRSLGAATLKYTAAASAARANLVLATGSGGKGWTITGDVPVTLTPTFTAVAPICSGAGLSPLPTTSGNGITGTWAPALNNTVTTNYTFTPGASQCALTQTLSITVNPNVTPTFTAVPAICSGGTLSPLPSTSGNGITGTWAPALNNTATTNYTFTPTAGQCALTLTLTITVNPIVSPTFTAVPAICSGGTLSPLPTTSGNGITGTWAPALNNTATTNYTFTPTAGQCALTQTLTITVNPNVTPTFTAVAAICSGGTLAPLPSTSGNGITGTWSPALNNTATTNYTFTPTAGQCALTQTLTITVNPNVTPAFTAVPAICSGGTLSPLPSTSGNGISGTWSPALNNTASTNYTFTPTAGQCALSNTLTVTVNPNVTPTFTAVPAICSGGTLSPLPAVSGNGIMGTWSPALNNTATTHYTFTPIAGCALTQTLAITVNPIVIPSFTAVAVVICSGAALPPLPTSSDNGITGSWSPALTNTATTQYTFTPTAGQCALTLTLTIVISPTVSPTFTAVPAICSGGTLAPLPTTSGNGITGTWSPALNNTTTTNYTFTPTAGQCALNNTLTVLVNPLPDVSTTLVANVITVAETGATYQWINCGSGNSIISSATGRSYTATANGTYAVIVTKGVCTQTSSCVSITSTGIDQPENSFTISVYPNPASSVLYLESDIAIESIVIYNLLGEAVQAETRQSFSVEALGTGIFILQVGTAKGMKQFRFVKE